MSQNSSQEKSHAILDVYKLKAILSNIELKKLVDETWETVGKEFSRQQLELPAEKAMERTEISFHEQVKFLGYISYHLKENQGDILEIGVYKGKSAAFMSRMCQHKLRVIGIDPMWFPNQSEEFDFYQKRIFPEVTLIKGFSELSIAQVLPLKPKVQLLHIDGGHAGHNVLLDFLLYSRFVVSGGVVIFDDYADHTHSPQVGPAVDLLRAGGYFKDYAVIGVIPGFENSYMLQKL